MILAISRMRYARTYGEQGTRMPVFCSVLSLIALRYVDEANLSERLKKVVRAAIPASAILLPAAFFLSVLSPDASRPNPLIYLAYVGAVVLAIGLVLLGVGLLREPPRGSG